MANVEVSLAGDWAETYPRKGHLALILPLAFEGVGTVKDLRLRVEGIHKPLTWVGCWHDRVLLPKPVGMTAPVVAACVFQGPGQHAAAYTVTLEGRSGWTWQDWGEFQLRPGDARYVVRPNAPIGRGQQRT